MATSTFLDFVRAVVGGELDEVARRLAGNPALASTPAAVGATRQESATFFFADIAHHVYAGDTALHMAAAAFRRRVAEVLLAHGAHCRARNRRGAEPLHYAADANRSLENASDRLTMKCRGRPSTPADPEDRTSMGLLHSLRAMFLLDRRRVGADGWVVRHGRDEHEVRIGSRRFRVYTEMGVAPVDFNVSTSSVEVLPEKGWPIHAPAASAADAAHVLSLLAQHFEKRHRRTNTRP